MSQTGRPWRWVDVSTPECRGQWTLVEERKGAEEEVESLISTKRPETDAAALEARWLALLDAVLADRLHEGIPEAAVDGIALVPSRTVEYADHEVRIVEGTAEECSCLDDRTRHSCAHRMAVAVRLWQRDMLGAGMALDRCDPYAVAADYRYAWCQTLLTRYLTPSSETLRERAAARFAALRQRMELPPEVLPPAERLRSVRRVNLL